MTEQIKAWPQAFHFSEADPRFCFCSHVPKRSGDAGGPARLLVAIHGSGRDAMAYRDALAGFADEHDYNVLCPLFPVSPHADGNGDGYKYLIEKDLRYDLVLLRMVEQFERSLGRTFGRFDLFGFSGGAHFAHRFFYLHTERLETVTIGAPGGVTLLDDTIDWWVGTRGMKEMFGAEPDIGEIRRVPVHLLIGSEDTEEFSYEAGPNYRPEAIKLGRNRQQRLEALHRSLVEHGVSVEKTVVDGVAHEGLKLISSVTGFLSRAKPRLSPRPMSAQ